VLLPLLIFLTVTLGVIVGYHLLTRLLSPPKSPERRRLAEEFRKTGPEAPRTTPFKHLDQLSVDTLTGGMSDLGLAELAPPPTRSDWGLSARLQEVLEQAGLDWSVWQVLLLGTCLGACLGALGWWLWGPAAAALALLGPAAPLAWVHWRRKRRQERFLRRLPGAFDLMARALRGGHSVPQALQAVVESCEEPLAATFAHCLKLPNLEEQPEAGFQELARRTGVVEMRIFVMATLIRSQVGGSLPDVLERVAMLIRARLRLREQVWALTAEGRLRGLALLILPFVVFAGLVVVNRGYAQTLLEHVPLLAGIGVSMLVGVLWIRKIVNFEV
jgi:tight adherence protein B